MPNDPLVERVRALVRAFLPTDLIRLRIESDGEHIELRRRRAGVLQAAPVRAAQPVIEKEPLTAEPIKADIVGVVHLNRPLPAQGEIIESDRELAYVEALGIRNPVRSLGPGRLISVRCHDGEPVEYGQVLFEIARA